MQLSKPTIDMPDGRIPFCDSPPNSSYPYCATFEQSNGIDQGNYYCPTEQPLYSAFRESAFGELMKALTSSLVDTYSNACNKLRHYKAWQTV